MAQGANDPRVKKAESEQIVIALRDRGFPVEYILAPDEGHGFARPVNNMALFAESEKFFAGHIGGRYQETMTPEVEARLKEITVDPKTVMLTKKVDPASRRRPEAGRGPGAEQRQLQGGDQRQRPDDEPRHRRHREGRRRLVVAHRSGQNARWET